MSEGYPRPGEILHRHLLLPPHGAVVAGSRSGRDGIWQQAYTEFAPQSAKNKYNRFFLKINQSYFELIRDILGVW